MAVHHVLIKASTQIQLSSAGCYQMETMVILEEKKKKKSFCKLGAYIYVCIWQSCRPYQSKMLHLEWHSSKISLCFYLPTAHSLLELRACLGFGAVEPSTSCNMKKKSFPNRKRKFKKVERNVQGIALLATSPPG